MAIKQNFLVCKDLSRTLRGYETVDSVERLVPNIGNIGILIFHSSIDDELSLYRFLGILKDKRPVALIYANAELNYSLVPIFETMKADIYNTEDILTDKNTLNFCITKYGKSPLALKSSANDINRLNKFISDIKGDSSKALLYVNNPMWLSALSNSVQRISFELQKYEQATGQMVSVVQNIDETVQSLEKNSANQQTEMLKLAESLKTMEAKYNEALVQQSKQNTDDLATKLLHNKNSLNSFPPYQAKPSVPYTTYIKVKKSCPYLLTFLLCFIQAMRMQKRKNVKLILLLPKGKTWIQYHDSFKALTPENLKFSANAPLDSVGYWTADPTSKFWDYIFKETHKVDGFIVVDYIMDDVLLLGSKITYMRAGIGSGTIKGEDLSAIPVENTFFSLEGDPKGIVLKTIEGYESLTVQVRGNKYFNEYRDTAYPRLATLLHLQ